MYSMEALLRNYLETMWAEVNEQIECVVGGRSHKMTGETSSQRVLRHKRFTSFAQAGFAVCPYVGVATAKPIEHKAQAIKQITVDK